LVIRIRKTGKYVEVLTIQELHEHQFDDMITNGLVDKMNQELIKYIIY
jgi:hypothetical protein